MNVAAVPSLPERTKEMDEDYRPSRDSLSNKEVRSTGILCGGAISSIAEELLRLRAVVQLAEHKIEQHLQGQYPDGAALKAALRAIRDPLSLT